jgi:hypothetical protein
MEIAQGWSLVAPVVAKIPLQTPGHSEEKWQIPFPEALSVPGGSANGLDLGKCFEIAPLLLPMKTNHRTGGWRLVFSICADGAPDRMWQTEGGSGELPSFRAAVCAAVSLRPFRSSATRAALPSHRPGALSIRRKCSARLRQREPIETYFGRCVTKPDLRAPYRACGGQRDVEVQTRQIYPSHGAGCLFTLQL